MKCRISDNSRVKSSLKSRHFALDDVLDLVRQLRLDVLLQTSQQKGSKNFVQTTDDQNRFFLVQLNLFASDSERGVEPLLEGVAGTKDRRQQKVEQRPEFRKFVLQRRSGEQQPVVGRVVRVQDLRQLAVVVLHAVALVDDHVLPTDLWSERTYNYWKNVTCASVNNKATRTYFIIFAFTVVYTCCYFINLSVSYL